MTPEEKAKELVDKFYKASKITIQGTDSIFKQNAPKLALIAIEELLPICKILDQERAPLFNEWAEEDDLTFEQYWEQVKQHLQAL